MHGQRLETDPGVGSFLPCHYFGNGWGNFQYSAFYLVYRDYPVSASKTQVLPAALLVPLEEHEEREEGERASKTHLDLTEIFSSFQPLTKPATSLWAQQPPLPLCCPQHHSSFGSQGASAEKVSTCSASFIFLKSFLWRKKPNSKPPKPYTFLLEKVVIPILS